MTDHPTPVSVGGEQQAFEAAYIDHLGLRLEDYDLSFDQILNRYSDDDIQSAWWAWQARGALPPPPPQGEGKQQGDVVPEGCTPADARMLRAANHGLASENDRLRKALEFYAEGGHFTIHDTDVWDTVSGEPANFWEDESNTATVEDGSVAKAALASQGSGGDAKAAFEDRYSRSAEDPSSAEMLAIWLDAWNARGGDEGIVQWPTMPPSKGQSHILFEDGYAEGWAKCLDACREAVLGAVDGRKQP